MHVDVLLGFIHCHIFGWHANGWLMVTWIGIQKEREQKLKDYDDIRKEQLTAAEYSTPAPKLRPLEEAEMLNERY